MDLLQVLREYEAGEFKKEDIMEIYQRWVKNGDVDQKELIHLTNKPFYGLYADVMGVVRNLSIKKVSEVAIPATDFIESFDELATMQKKQLAELSGKSEPWIFTVKDNFVQNRKGVNIKSYLKWLKNYDHNAYSKFKENYK